MHKLPLPSEGGEHDAIKVHSLRTATINALSSLYYNALDCGMHQACKLWLGVGVDTTIPAAVIAEACLDNGLQLQISASKRLWSQLVDVRTGFVIFGIKAEFSDTPFLRNPDYFDELSFDIYVWGTLASQINIEVKS